MSNDRDTGGAKAREELKAHAREALRLKKAAGPQTTTPPHRSARDGEVGQGEVNRTDTAVGREPTFTPNLKRSHNARSGDA